MLALLLALVAYATDPSPGVLLTGSHPVAPGWWSGSGRLSTGYLVYGALSDLGDYYPSFAVTAEVGGVPARGLLLRGVAGVGVWGGATGALHLAARYNVVERPAFGFGVTLDTVSFFLSDEGYIFVGAAGLAFAGGRRVQADASVPALMVVGDVFGARDSFDMSLAPIWANLIAFEAGVSFPVGQKARMRVGKYPAALGLSVRTPARKAYVEFALASSLVITYGLVEVGYDRPDRSVPPREPVVEPSEPPP